MAWDRKRCVLVVGQKVLLFCDPRTKNADYWWSVDRKYCFLVVLGQKILIFGGPGIEHIASASPASENLVLSWSRDIRCIFIGLGSKYIDFPGPGTSKKYCLLVVQG